MWVKRISFFGSVIGLILSISGLFLPWGKEEWGSGLGARGDYFLGIELLPGTFALVGCAVTAVFLLLYMRKNKRYLFVLVLLGGLMTIFSSLAWIVNPNDLAWHWEWHQEYGIILIISLGISYKVLYGAYISLIGSVLTSSSANFQLFTQFKNQDSPK